MSSDFESLARRIQVLEDIAAIQRLKANYSYQFDNGRMDQVIDLYSEDATLDVGPPFGIFGSKAEIADFYKGQPAQLPFTLHHNHNPLVTIIDETNAKAVWQFHSEAVVASTGKAVVFCGRYYDTYVKVGSDWKFKSVKVNLFYASEPTKGWAKQRWAFPTLTVMGSPQPVEV